MDKKTEVEELIINLESDDVANATQACRVLQDLLGNDDYAKYHPRIKAALEDAYDAWGDKNCNNWASEDD